jgi:hypothetical protein
MLEETASEYISLTSSQCHAECSVCQSDARLLKHLLVEEDPAVTIYRVARSNVEETSQGCKCKTGHRTLIY